jgi:hypothetical protein
MADIYQQARRQSYAALEAALAPMGIDARAGIIGLTALQAWRSTWLPLYDYARAYGDWPWESLAQEYDSPGRFELALWAGDDLCALAIGPGVSAGFRHVTWSWVESWRQPNLLNDRALQAADFCVSAYALGLGVRIVHVDCPAPGLAKQWTALGACRDGEKDA